jgi:hypothetical protein
LIYKITPTIHKPLLCLVNVLSILYSSLMVRQGRVIGVRLSKAAHTCTDSFICIQTTTIYLVFLPCYLNILNKRFELLPIGFGFTRHDFVYLFYIIGQNPPLKPTINTNSLHKSYWDLNCVNPALLHIYIIQGPNLYNFRSYILWNSYYLSVSEWVKFGKYIVEDKLHCTHRKDLIS